MDNNLKIAVAYYKEYPIHHSFNGDTYALVACGNYQCVKMFKDDTKYSHLNLYINESSVLYWLYENQARFNNPEYLGLFHYRRRLILDGVRNVNSNTVVTSEITLWHPVKDDFEIQLGKDGISFLLKMINYAFAGSCQQTVDAWLRQSVLYQKNMFVMPKAIFNDYAKVLAGLIDDIVIPSLDTDAVKKQPRFFGFCLEWFTGFYMYHLEHCKHIDVIKVPLANV